MKLAQEGYFEKMDNDYYKWFKSKRDIFNFDKV